MFQELLDVVTANRWIGEVFLITLGTGLVRLFVKLALDRVAVQFERAVPIAVGAIELVT